MTRHKQVENGTGMSAARSNHDIRAELSDINVKVKDILAQSENIMTIIDRELPRIGADIRSMRKALKKLSKNIDAMEEDHILTTNFLCEIAAGCGASECAARLEDEDRYLERIGRMRKPEEGP